MTEKKRKPKSSAPRTEVFAMRLDPKLKYLAEIAARQQRRSLANFIEWSISSALDNVSLDEGVTVSKAVSKLWAIDESNRLIQLGRYFPDLLTYDEQLIWKLIHAHTIYDKKSNLIGDFLLGDVDAATGDGKVDCDLVEKCWPEIKAYALGTGTLEELNSVLLKHYDPDSFL
jgi:hypothetical protein